MEISFKDKVVLVTGASAGIGEAIALLFAKYQARLALVGRSQENLKAVARRCEDLSKEAPLEILADLATDEGCEAVAKKTIEHFGRLDVLINNAGISARTTLLATDMATFDGVFDLNVRGVYNLTRLLAKELIKTKGNIVNISSIAGTLVSKILTRMTNISEEEYQKWLERSKSAIPMGEVCTGDDIAYTVVHLASDRSRLVTGALVTVDGGALYGETGNLLTSQIK